MDLNDDFIGLNFHKTQLFRSMSNMTYSISVPVQNKLEYTPGSSSCLKGTISDSLRLTKLFKPFRNI